MTMKILTDRPEGVGLGDFGAVATWGGAALVSGLVAGAVPGVSAVVLYATFVGSVVLIAFALGRAVGRTFLMPGEQPTDGPIWFAIMLFSVVGLIAVTYALSPPGLDATPIRGVFYATGFIAMIQFGNTLARMTERVFGRRQPCDGVAELVPSEDTAAG